MTDRTKTWGDRFHEFFNGIAAQVGPVTGQIGELGMGLQGLKPILTGVGGALGGLGGLLISSFKGLAAKVIPTAAASGLAVGEAEGAAEAEGATSQSMLQKFLAKFGLMTGAKVGAAAIAGEAEGLAEGEAEATAASGPASLSRFKIAGGKMGGALSVGFAAVAVVGVVAATTDATNKIQAAQKQVGTDLKSFIASAPSDAEIQARIDALKKVPDSLDPVKRALFEMDVSGVKSEWQGSIDELSKYLQMDAAQKLAYSAQVAAVGVPSAFDRGWATAGPASGQALDKGIAQGISDNSDLPATALKASLAAAAAGQDMTPFTELGKVVPKDIATGMVDQGQDLLDAGDRLIQLLKTGLTPAEEAAKLEGKKYTDAVAQGIHSEIPGAKQAAQEMAIQAIKTISDAAGGAPGTKGLKAIGQYYTDLLGSGLSSEQAAAALKAAGVADAVIAKLTGRPVQQQLTVGGQNDTQAWMKGLQQGITDGTNPLKNKINHIAQMLIGLSPPPEGPLHLVDVGGRNIGHSWHAGLIQGINDGNQRLDDALGAVSRRIGGARPGSFAGAIGAAGRSITALIPQPTALALAGPGNMAVNITIEGYPDDAAIRKLGLQLNRVLGSWSRSG